MTRVVGYVRVSSEQQIDNYSLDGQRRAIRHHCEYQGHELIDICADEGRSAYSDTLAKRPELRRAIDMVLAGGADAIVVDKLDRLARNARVFHDVLHRLNNRVIFVKEGIDPTTPTGELVAGILAQSAQFFSRNLAVETRKGKTERIEAGLWAGRLPYGYRRAAGDDKSRLAPVFDDTPAYGALSRADVVREAFALTAAGTPRRQIMVTLRQRGVEDMGPGLLHSILHNRFYVGQIGVGRNNSSQGATQWLPGLHAALIDQETFDRAQLAGHENRRGPAVISRGAVHTLSGLGTCGKCGGRFHTQTQRGQVRLHCSTRLYGGECQQVSVFSARIEQQVVAALTAYSLTEALAERYAAAAEHQTHDTTEEQTKVAAQLRRLEAVYVEYGHMSELQYRNQARHLQGQLQALRTHAGGSQAQELAQLLTNLAVVYERAEDEATRNRLVRRVFRELLIDNQEIVALRPLPGLGAILTQRAEAQSSWLAGCRRPR